MSALGLIAGGGELPRAVAQAVRASGRAVFVVPLVGSVSVMAPDVASITTVPHWDIASEPVAVTVVRDESVSPSDCRASHRVVSDALRVAPESVVPVTVARE